MRIFVKHPWRIVLAGGLAVGAWGAFPGRAVASGTPGPTWSVLSPPTSPPGLRNASAAYDAANQSVVVFGGQLADGRLSDGTWIWNGSTWSQAAPYGAIPPARAWASMAYDAGLDQLVLFGGEGAGGKLLDDLWVWNGASWNQVTQTVTPGAREGAALAPGPSGSLVLFGGYGYSNAPAPPPASTTTTTEPRPVTRHHRGSPKVGAAPKTGATVESSTTSASSTSTTTTTLATSTTTDPLRTASEAGSPAPLDDTWTLGSGGNGTDAWTADDPSVRPAPVAGASMAPAGTDTVLFGGTDGRPGASGSALSAATWAWDGTAWQPVRARTYPTARTGAVAAYDSDLDEVVLFGGRGPTGALDDTWAFTGGTWSELRLGSRPPGRSGAVAAYDAASRQMVLFGGATGGGGLSPQTIVLTSLPPTPVSSHPTTTPPTSAPAGGSPSRAGAPTSTAAAGRSRTAATGSASPGSARSAAVTALHRGDVVTLTGSGFLPRARVTITFHSVPAVVVATTRADRRGDFRVDVSVPIDAAMGTHHFIATGKGPTGITTLITPVRVVALVVAHGISELAKTALTGIAIAIPLLTWSALALRSRVRRLGSSPSLPAA